MERVESGLKCKRVERLSNIDNEITSRSSNVNSSTFSSALGNWRQNNIIE